MPLKIKTNNGLGDNNPTFHDIELTEYTYKATRMGMPELSATLQWPTCLDDEWSGKEYVEFMEERFYISSTPTSEQSNTDARFKHDITFSSENANILGNVYFYDTVYNQSLSKDKVCSSSTKFTFYGTLFEVCDRLNCALRYRGIGDSLLATKTNVSTLDTPTGDGFVIMVDETYNDYEASWEFSMEDESIWDAITSVYEKTEIPFERRGKRIIFGTVPKVVSKTLKQGFDNELLSVTHTNANTKVINRITMIGSSENIPYYYPNPTEYGNITIDTKGNTQLLASKISIVNHSQLLAALPSGKRALLAKKDPFSDILDFTTISTSFNQGSFQSYILGIILSHEYEQGAEANIDWNIKIAFTVTAQKQYVLSDLDGHIWVQNTTGQYDEPSRSLLQGAYKLALTKHSKEYPVKKTESGIDLGTLGAGNYELSFSLSVPNSTVYHLEAGQSERGINIFCSIDSLMIRARNSVSDDKGYTWKIGEKEYKTGQLGIKMNTALTDAMVGESFGWVATGRMPFQEGLMPPKYRSTNGMERFYEATDNTYTDPDTGKKYTFPNPYDATHPVEHIFKNEKIKPTITGIKNASQQLLGSIAAVAFDDNDNDSLKADTQEDGGVSDAKEYEHSFFYVKLHIFNGPYGFNLFNHASQTDPMTIQMTSGTCNGCKFKVQVVEFEDESGLKSVKNPVQTTGANGDIVSGDYNIKVLDDSFQDWQQNTMENSVWVCLQKDTETFGQILPSKTNNYVPAADDTFNIINIDLPQQYIAAAEKKLEEEGIRYMFDNNEEKFNLSISASRIYFAQNPDVLAEIDENCKVKVEYNGNVYEQYVESLTIKCDDDAPLPDISLELADEITVGQNFTEAVAERASSLIANPFTMGGGYGGGGGLNTAIADRRYLNKQMADRSGYKIASDAGFEAGSFVSGSQGAYLGIDFSDGTSFLEVDRLKVRLKAVFEELEVAKLKSVGGEVGITPGGSINISYVEERDDLFRCYFKGKEEDKGAECRFVVGDQVQCKEINITAGTTQDASNRYYWRLVVAVNNDMSYFDLSKADHDLVSNDIPVAGDTVMQLGNRDDATRQSAILLSTTNVFAPRITLYDKIDNYSLSEKEVVDYGVDKTKNPPEPFFHCYGSFYFGQRDESTYLKFDASVGKMLFKGELSSSSMVGDKSLEEYVANTAQNAADAAKEELQKQIDGVIEAFNGLGAPTLNNYPANEWTTDEERKRHDKDIYTDITPYVDDATTPTSGKSWKWYYNSPTDYGWVKIADSEAVRALQLAQMSVIDTDVLYKSHTSQTTAPALPVVNTNGVITDYKGWATTAPAWSASKYIWQTTYVKKGDGTAYFSDPTCIQGAAGESISITDTKVRYSTVHTAAQPSDDTFTLSDVPSLSEGQYLWSRTKVTYSNGESTVSYGVSRIGNDGADGASYSPNLLKNSYKTGSSNTKLIDNGIEITTRNIDIFFYMYVDDEVKLSGLNGKTATFSYMCEGLPEGEHFTFGIGGAYKNHILINKNGLNTTVLSFADYVDRPDGLVLFDDFGTNHPSTLGAVVKITKCCLTLGDNPTQQYVPAASEMVAPTITSTDVKYAKSTTASQPADSAFTYSSISATGVKVGEYLWTKTVVTYSDGKNTKTYSVSRIGADGTDGTPGAAGADGKTPYVHYAYANSANGVTGFSTTYFTDALYVGTCTDYNQADPTTPSSYEWARLKGADGTDAKTVIVNADATAFTYSDNFATLVGPQSIALSAILQGTSGYQWSYKLSGQSGFTNISGATSATYSLAHNASIWGSGTTTKAITLRCTSGGVHDEVTIVRVSSGANGTNGTNGTDGKDAYTVVLTNESHIFEGDTEKAIAGSTECGVIAYKGATQVTATIGAISGMPTGMTAAISSNGTTSAKFTVSVTTDLTTKQGVLNVPVTVGGKSFTKKFSWSLSLKGKDGRGIVSTVEMYAVSSSNTTAPADSAFSTTVPTTTTTNRYLWNYEISIYTDNTSEPTQKRVIGVHGQNGTDGAGISSITNYYLASAQDSGVTISTAGWTTDVTAEAATTTDGKPYLWNYEKVYYTKGSPTTTTPHIVGVRGRGVKSIKEQYYLSTSNTKLIDGSWSDTKQTWQAGHYYWTRSVITYTDGTTTTTTPICVTGERGSDGQSTYLLNIINSTAGILATASGTVTGAYPSPQAEVWRGSQKVMSGITYSISGTTGAINATINTSGEVTLSMLGTDTATVTVQAVVSGVTLQSVISLYKAKTGATGAAAVTYDIEPDKTVITKTSQGELSSDYVTCTVYRVTGSTNRQPDNSYTLKYTRLPDGATGTLTRSSGVSAPVTIEETTTEVVFELYNGSVLLDKEHTYVIQGTPENPNMLQGTQLWSGDRWRFVTDSGMTDEMYRGCKVFLYGGAANAPAQPVPTSEFEALKYYTFSVWMNVPTSRLGYLPRILDGNGTYHTLDNQIIVANTWTRVSVTILAETSLYFRIRNFLLPSDVAVEPVKICGMKVESGSYATGWCKNPNDDTTARFDYLTAAMQQDYNREGGLVQASTICLGRDGVTYAGSNGYYKNEKTPAFWAGGDMVDAATDGVAAEERPAKFMVRMDGSGYAAGNTVKFTEDQLKVGNDVIMDARGFALLGASNAATNVRKEILRISNSTIGGWSGITNPTVRAIATSSQSAVTMTNGYLNGFSIRTENGKPVTVAISGGNYVSAPTSLALNVLAVIPLPANRSPEPSDPFSLYFKPKLVVQVVCVSGSTGQMVFEESFLIKPVQTSDTSVTLSFNINTILQASGIYYLHLDFIGGYLGTGTTSEGTATFQFNGQFSQTADKQTVIGSDGFASVWGNTLLYIDNNAAIMRAGSYAFKVTTSGFYYSVDGGSGGATSNTGWKKLSWT